MRYDGELDIDASKVCVMPGRLVEMVQVDEADLVLYMRKLEKQKSPDYLQSSTG